MLQAHGPGRGACGCGAHSEDCSTPHPPRDFLQRSTELRDFRTELRGDSVLVGVEAEENSRNLFSDFDLTPRPKTAEKRIRSNDQLISREPRSKNISEFCFSISNCPQKQPKSGGLTLGLTLAYPGAYPGVYPVNY